MEHLHDDHSEPNIHVPYLCEVMYDEGDFDGYPSRAGFQIPAIAAGIFRLKTREQCISFLQTWMYFGLLWDFFRHIEGFNLWHFVIQADDGRQIVTTKKLPEYIRAWNFFEQARTVEERNKAFLLSRDRLRSLHILASFFCEGVPAGDARVRTVQLLSTEVSLSIQILADTLQHAGHKIYRGNYNVDWGFSPLLKLQMSQAGWCPRAIATCATGQQIHNLYLASTLGSISRHRDHGNCTDQICRWEQIDVATYTTQHRPDCPKTCSENGPNLVKLIAKYDQKRRPVIHYDVEHDMINVSDSTEVSSYAAISHVWGDGLGNQNRNALPVCQLRFIQHLVDQLQGSKAATEAAVNYWWCDTLCVLVHPGSDAYRKVAIREMRHTYANAAQVLALDAEMMSVPMNSSPVELYIRLKLSGWTRRLWTLQEAKLARKVVVQFADGVRSLSQIFDDVQADGQQQERAFYTRYSFLASTFFRPFLQQETNAPVPERMIDMWKQLQWRGTSRQADEAVCLATILGFDPSPILAISADDSEERMARFLKLIEIVPFVHLVQPPPRLAIAGFHWAPSSLLNCFRDNDTYPFRIVPGIGRVDSNGNGLQLERPGVIIGLEGDVSLSRFQWTGEAFWISVEMPSGETDIYKILYLFPQDQAQLRISGTKKIGNPAIIFLEAEGLPLGTKGMCVLGEVVDTVDRDEQTGSGGQVRLNFVTIVNIVPSSSSEGTVCPAYAVSKQRWQLA